VAFIWIACESLLPQGVAALLLIFDSYGVMGARRKIDLFQPTD